jgi:hypothetical protein
MGFGDGEPVAAPDGKKRRRFGVRRRRPGAHGAAAWSEVPRDVTGLDRSHRLAVSRHAGRNQAMSASSITGMASNVRPVEMERILQLHCECAKALTQTGKAR